MVYDHQQHTFTPSDKNNVLHGSETINVSTVNAVCFYNLSHHSVGKLLLSDRIEDDMQ